MSPGERRVLRRTAAERDGKRADDQDRRDGERDPHAGGDGLGAPS
jgi:hypothetical protein